MAYELTINRVMGLCSFESQDERPELAGHDLVATFREQMAWIHEHQLDKLYQAIEKAARTRDVVFDFLPDEEGSKNFHDPDLTIFPESEDPIVSGATSRKKSLALASSKRLVGLFKSRRYRMVLNGMTWETRVRPSMTACALERPRGVAKLWWTFEGVPADAAAKRRPTEEDSVRFIGVTRELADEGMPLLRKAYAEGFRASEKREPGEVNCDTRSIRVSLADNDSRPFAKLVDAMYLNKAKFRDVCDGKFGEDAAASAKELLKFIEDAGGETPDPDGIKLETSQPGATAIYYTIPIDTGRDGKKTCVVVGLASSVDMLSSNLTHSSEWLEISKRPSLLRSVSAARPLSAKLANEQAMKFEKV